jgi:hypothetical protein
VGPRCETEIRHLTLPIDAQHRWVPSLSPAGAAEREG